MTLVKVKVKLNSGRQGVEDKKDFFLVYLKSVPENNKANLELLKVLKKYFGKQVKIKSGFKSRNKIVEFVSA
ncbi:DUF167 domain-containing protein [Candidatus Pacearchaeota archaeon]|nr:DUF167 domain-containing protein [Candidatus Pacearchaeota archaeon]